MLILSRYLLRLTAGPFALVLVVLLGGLSLERFLRIIEEVAKRGAPLLESFQMLAFLTPHYLGLAVPAALFLGVLLAIRRLQDESELTAMEATGASPTRPLRPVGVLAVVVAVILSINAGLIQPHARYHFRALMHDAKQAPAMLQIDPGVFHRVGDSLVVRANEVDDSGRNLKGFFAEDSKGDGNSDVLTARSARVRAADTRESVELELYDGSVLRVRDGEVQGSMAFTRYNWLPPLGTYEPYGPRGRDGREMTFPELLSDMGGNAEEPKNAALRGEFHSRLVRVLSLPFMALMAVPLARLGRGRMGRFHGLGIGVVGLIGYEKLLGLGEAFSAQGALSPWLALWTPLAGLAVMTGLATWLVLLRGPRRRHRNSHWRDGTHAPARSQPAT